MKNAISELTDGDAVELLAAHELDAIRHAMDVAHRTLEDNEKLWSCAEPNALVTQEGVAQLGQLFKQYVDRLEPVIIKLSECDRVLLVTEGGAE